MKHSRLFERRTKIACTIGPATGSAAVIERLIRAGMDVARLNLSHGMHREHARHIQTIRKLSQRLAIPVAILTDLPGPKYRKGRLKNGQAALKEGVQVILTTKQVEGSDKVIPINLPALTRDVKAGIRVA
jgi:pyruvate kinase